ncbi:MAG: class I SAM-dependent DNA methyltransferase [Phycisphaerae bacterium]|nr:class I SAM-dependent DNA methyltransferase [Phycisphaerae bacterium]
MSDARRLQLEDFVAYAKSLKGDEKGEAQVFLDRLFRAFSRAGYKEAGATLEQRVRGDAGGTRFADLVWKPVVLIEMKKRGEDLAQHLPQAFRYWEELVPGRPRYVVLCNFDEFWVYDFDQDIHQPQDIVALDELPERYGPLNFLWPTNEPVHFRVDREKATREAADILASVYRKLKGKHPDGPAGAQRFALQALVCFFSEDIGLLPKHFFTQLLDECLDPPKAFDLLDGLFRAMNAKSGTRGGRFSPVPYFNGGIFAKSAAVELDPQDEVSLLKRAATYDWSHVSPDIFGTIFQSSMDTEERHAFGAHYTSQIDIMRIVGPTIVQPFAAALERASTLRELTALRDRLTTLRVLDPACGSGNFLYIAYREMRRVEAAIVRKLSELSSKEHTGQTAFAGVSPRQFFGMDILPFAVELAKVTLSLAPKLASDELHTTEATLPLANLDRNVLAKDALINADGTRAEWPDADIIIGNPPFLGAKRLKPERGADYVNAVREAYAEVPGMADYCVYWFRHAHDHLAPATPDNPFTGRAGLVGTQNIRNNQSRVGGLDHVVKSGVIVEAVENMPWSGEANVHVSIANWVKVRAAMEGEKNGATSERALLIPKERRLWSKVELTPELFEGEKGKKRPRIVTVGKRGRIRMDKSYEMERRTASEINSALTDTIDLSVARKLICNTEPQRSFNGQMLGHEAFLLTREEAAALTKADPASRAVLHPYLNGREFLAGTAGKPQRFVLDFEERDQLEAARFAAAYEWVKSRVLPDRQRKAKEGRSASGEVRSHHKGFLERWWQLSFGRPELRSNIRKLSRYLACSLVTKRAVFVFIDSRIRPSNLLQAFCFEDDYSFSILQSGTHWSWFVRQSSKLKSDYRFGESVWTTFPWPQSPTKKQIRAAAAAGRQIRAIRDKVLPSMKGGLRALYRTLELPGANPLKDAHAALDAAVLEAYGFSPKKDILKQLLDLNLAVASSIERGEPVTAPGVPPSYGDPADLMTEDCIRP